MQVERKQIDVVCDGTGAFTGYTDAVTGRILGITVVVPGSGGIANTADLTFTAEKTGEAVLTLTNQNGSGSFYPRVGTHDTAGAAALYAAGGTAVRDAIAVVNDRIKVVVAQGGIFGLATIYVIIG